MLYNGQCIYIYQSTYVVQLVKCVVSGGVVSILNECPVVLFTGSVVLRA
jgi:hypothetical protein